MKNLSLISFVGVDLETDLLKLKSLNDLSDIDCEFGVLYSESKKGKRYPGYEFCEEFLHWAYDLEIKSSIHLCGSEAINKFLDNDPVVINMCTVASRTQLNINIKNFEDYEKLANEILGVSNLFNITCILQQNATKQKFNEIMLGKIADSNKIHFLHDSSGGFGREITKVDSPSGKYFTGYAGGINPENVSRIVNLVESANIDNNKFYIDMESGIRESNIFSIEKCQSILDNLR